MKVLMVGLGGIGQRHVRNMRALLGSGVEISAYRTRGQAHVLTDQLTIEPGSDLEEKYNIKKTYGDIDEAIAQKPEAVFICNPTSLHIPVALPAARAGCHLFIEKALSHNLDGVEELINVVEEKNLVALVAYQMRFHPCLKYLHSLLKQRAIGRVVAVRAEVGEYLPGWHTYEDYRQMYASRRDLGGGVVISQIHEMDYLYWLFGPPKRVFALGGHLSSLEIDVEDTASILMECVFEGQPMPVHLHQDYLQRPPGRTCQVIGDAGKILLDFHALKVNVFDARGELSGARTFEGFQRNQLFIDVLNHFLACVEGKEKPVVSVRDGAESLKIALAAKRSIETGEVVGLDGGNGG
jgi:predicted dehydrogenase